MKKPQPKTIVNHLALSIHVKAYVDSVDNEEITTDERSDMKQTIFEQAITDYYGEGVWNYINDKL